MSSILLINAAGRETRVALVENGHIAEFYLERKKDKGIVGNIYKGRVVRVLPGMQAAFVDIGEEKAAFLYVSDVVYDPDFARAQFELTEGEHEDAPEVPELSDPDTASQTPHEGAEAQTAHEGGGEPPAEAPGHPAPSGASAHPEGGPSTAEAERSGADVERHVAGELPAMAEGALPPVERSMALASEIPAFAPIPRAEADLGPSAEAQAQAEAAAEAVAAVPETAAGPAVAAVVPLPEAGSDDVGATAGAADAGHPAPAPEGPSEVRGARRAPREMRERSRERPRRRDERERGRHGHGHDDEEKGKPRKTQRIEDLLKVGQEVLVQISKDPIGTKGARLTSHISIPGRHLVFMPTVDHVGISRRISNERERRRLRDLVERLRPPGTGFIVRTVAENVPQEKLESDIRFLIEVWNQVVRQNEKHKGPGLMHPDLDLILRATRDLFAQDVEKLVVDDRDEYERILGFVTAQDPGLRDRVSLHEGEEPIFDAYGVEHEINRALQRKVWLRSGGYLIIDQAEALTAIDVNSGRYVGKKSLEETITKINMEAAKEIVYQLRLRNIGGIIICDFIDMEKQQNREKVFKALQETLGRDKAKTNVLRISELGLVEMTRKRVRESIGRILHEDCSYCDGQGFVKTPTTVAYEIFREIRREGPNFKDPTLVINCSTEVAKLLQGEEREELRHLMDRFNKTIQVKPQQHYHREQYDLYGRSAQGTDQKLAQSEPRRADGSEKASRPDGRGRGGGDRPRREEQKGDRRDRDERREGRRDGRRDERREGRREERRGDDRPREQRETTQEPKETPEAKPPPGL